MQRYLHWIEQRLIYFARRAGIKLFVGIIASVLVVLGLAFLTVALWILVTDAFGTLVGAAVLGAGFIGLGVISLLLGTVRRRTPPPPPPPAYSSPQSASIVALVEAFMVGMRAGKGDRDKG